MENTIKFLSRIIKPGLLRIRFILLKYFTKTEFVDFTCTVCGNKTTAPLSLVKGRESSSCSNCGSNRRFRSIIAVLSHELFGEIKPLPQFPHAKNIQGLGLSDSHVYSGRLEKKLKYTNTFYHKSPMLDIMNIDENQSNTVDFIITSDVLEHVPPPVERAFENLYSLLKKGGLCILSVPYYNSGETKEHYPDLHEYKISKVRGEYILHNRTKTGVKQEFSNLRFHGGPGATLEMRFFAKSSLLENIKKAGFTDIRLHEKSYPEFGIFIDPGEHSLVISMRKA